MICPKCGSNVLDGSAFCENCGASLAEASVATATAAAASVAAAAAAADQTVAKAAAAPAASQYAQYSQGGPSVHYSSQQAYNQGKAPGYTAQQASYQQQSYQQTYQQQYQQQQQAAAAQKVYAQTTGTSRALAMSTYWGLLPLIFAWVVGDKDTDTFLRHHLNQALVLFIATLISSFLAVFIIGGLLAIVCLVFIIMGTIQAYHGEMTELPLIGKIKILK